MILISWKILVFDYDLKLKQVLHLNHFISKIAVNEAKMMSKAYVLPNPYFDVLVSLKQTSISGFFDRMLEEDKKRSPVF